MASRSAVGWAAGTEELAPKARLAAVVVYSADQLEAAAAAEVSVSAADSVVVEERSVRKKVARSRSAAGWVAG